MQVYPKFKSKEECAYPERTNCNYDESDLKSERCPYMKCICMGQWHCIYKKQSNCDNKQEQPTKEVGQ